MENSLQPIQDRERADDSTQALARIDQARRALDRAMSIDEIAAIRDKAEILRQYARYAGLGLQLHNQITELKLRAERKAGHFLSELKLRGGDRKSKDSDDRLKLADLGITSNQSKRWQKEATIPDDLFESFVERANSDGVELSSAALLRLASLWSKTTSSKADEQPPSSKSPPADENSLHSYRVNGAHKTVVSAHGRFLDAKQVQDMEIAIDEMIGHTQTLARILDGIWNSDDTALTRIERNSGHRYMNEIEELLDVLKGLLR